MANTVQLLKLVRGAAANINSTTDNPEYRALLNSADCVLNELLLEASPDFYLDHIAQGKALLEEGRNLLARMDKRPASTLVLRDDLTADMRIEAFDAEISRLYQCMLPVVEFLDESRSVAEKTYLVKLSAWESGFHEHRAEQARGSSHRPEKTINRDSLQAYLAKKFPDWKQLKVTKFVALDGGFSKKTILFETEDSANGHQSMVIRAEQPVTLLPFAGSDVTREFWMIQLMRKAGLPIAKPLWLEDDREQLGTRFIVSRKAEGKTYGGNFGSDEKLSPELLQSMLATFYKMHNIKVDPADPLAQKSHLKEWLPYVGSLHEATRYCVTDYFRSLISNSGMPMTPLLLRALKWLEQNIPETDETPVVVHIDFSFNNLIIDQNRITAVLDWESSRLGDPADDIIWTQMVLSPYLSMPEFLKAYKASTGRDVSEYRLAYSRVAKSVLNNIVCTTAMRGLDNHDGAHINMAILGYQYMSMVGTQFNKEIAAAENLRGK